MYSALKRTIGRWGWVISSKHFFSESSHVAYRSKVNGAQGTMQPHIMSLHTSLAPGMGSKGQKTFCSESSRAAYKIKGNGA